MIDIDRQVAFWREGAQEDWVVARELVDRGRTRHGLFFAHLALEKMLKAHIVRHTQDLAPRIHNLVRLAQLAEFELTSERLDILAEMNAFNIEGRYPEALMPLPTEAEAQRIVVQAEEIFSWLMNQL